ncbi:hypothetical protein EKO04_003145 [Ascochyta lentis]|uniref:Uncharacterized protein n=1 Tax=Ascochyta lentis TaxID=205686 RepID=A0A8H7J8I1_9PLEO|nr:hypothetical protein EKO04_003145 [Ascochyta lentis]
MASRHQRQAPIQTPELMLSDSEDSHYSSEDEMSERDQTDHLLRQAHHYVITEGGNDSPTTFMERIQRIDRSLLREIVKYSYECDPKLYRAVRQKVDHLQREFEDAVEADSSVYDFEEMPAYYTAAADEGLYRMDSSPVVAEAPSSRHKAQPATKNEAERTYLYGGPGNDPERWHKNYPASLPFPETIRMADWESLRIHYDLATTGNLDNKEPVTSIGVSFKDPLLAHHDNLAQYESGSRFKLPVIQPLDIAKVEKISTPEKLHEAVNAFNQGDNTTHESGEYNYAPRVFLDRLEVGYQISPQHRRPHHRRSSQGEHIDHTVVVDDVRSAVNTTPTKPRSSSSDNDSTPAATHELLNEEQQALTSGLGEFIDVHRNRMDNSNDLLFTTKTHRSNKPYSHTTAPAASSPTDRANSPAIRRIKAATEAAVRSSPQPHSPPAQAEATQTQTATRILIPAKRPRSRPSKDFTTAATTREYQSTAGGTKRKRLSQDPTYKPLADEEEKEEEADKAEEQPAKRKRNATTSGRHKAVRELRREGPKLSAPFAVEGPKTPAVTSAETPASSTSVVSTPPVRKARAAGKQKRRIRTKRDFEERVSPEMYRELMGSRHTPLPAEGHESMMRGSTRSGRVRAV